MSRAQSRSTTDGRNETDIRVRPTIAMLAMHTSHGAVTQHLTTIVLQSGDLFCVLWASGSQTSPRRESSSPHQVRMGECAAAPYPIVTRNLPRTDSHVVSYRRCLASSQARGPISSLQLWTEDRGHQQLSGYAITTDICFSHFRVRKPFYALRRSLSCEKRPAPGASQLPIVQYHCAHDSTACSSCPVS